ncbi:FYVE, RhoGEF and PH domain-containing protein 2 [Chelonia mydas]|uniref:FYVE, RhoGEF and PH domain-containing protein 2 n=1 Tax=Chelonia mydas TaxID=8469 RepID=M7BW39_CHEMY|nr:FYVE, RhoGEF and PH domain-containing protein 2 [Chelonia mydas]
MNQDPVVFDAVQTLNKKVLQLIHTSQFSVPELGFTTDQSEYNGRGEYFAQSFILLPITIVSAYLPADREALSKAREDRAEPENQHEEHQPSLSVIQPPQHQEPEENPPQGRRGLTVKCLRSFKSKINSSNWRSQQPVDSQPGSELSPGGSRNQDPEEKKIALELLETEKAYVNRLHLLDQVFFAELMKEARSGKTIPEDVVKMIFSNISSIYQFHALFFLPELQKRMEDWSSNPRIGDVIQKLAPFLKMYGEYVKNFDKAVELIATWWEKSPPFQELIVDIQGSGETLTFAWKGASPSLVLLGMLSPCSPSGLIAEALEMIFSAAKHSNAAIAEMERLQNLWEVYQRLGLEDDIVDPSNELIKEGPIQKISFRNNTTSEKYLFLFNNMLLYCVPKVIQVGAEFQVRWRIDVEGMKVRILKDVEFPHSFLVSGKQLSLELQARSQEEMNAWMKAFQDAIAKKEKQNESFKTAVHGPDGEVQEFAVKSEQLGRRAPQWVRDKLVTMCMRCKEPFNAITRRRHPCRACGYVVCARCSDYRAPLQYDRNRPNRVCLECYVFLTGHLLPEEREGKNKGILEKESAEISGQSLMCSFLQLLDKNGKGGTRGWFVIPQDDPLVLYMYAAPQDVKAHTSIPLLGYQVKELPQSDPRHLFQLVQSKQIYTFVAETEELKQRWMKIMEQSAMGNAHLPGGEVEDDDSFDDLE